MEYAVITQPNNGDAEVVFFLEAQMLREAVKEACTIAQQRDEAVLLATILRKISP